MLKLAKVIYSNFYLLFIKVKNFILHTLNIILLGCKVFYKENKIWIFDSADYANIGDLAISKAEIQFIQEILPKHHIISIGMKMFPMVRIILFPLVKDKDLIFLNGGGNIGNFYKRGENIRRIIIKKFPNNHIILFPQTIFFSDDENGYLEFRESKQIYSNHKKLLLSARENISHQIFMNNFSNKVILIPDIVFWLNISKTNIKRKGAIICLRNDLESILTQEQKQSIYKQLKLKFQNIEYTDTVGDNSINAVFNKISLFQEKEIIITDRIHGMIFAAISGTPCIALSNYNYKVIGTYNWLKNLEYIKLAESIEDISNHLSTIDFTKTYIYDHQHFKNLFQPLIQYIKNLE